MLVGLDFNDITSASISTTQYQMGNWLVFNATFGGWDWSGFNAAHALQQSGTVQGGAGDYALMIYGDNVATQARLLQRMHTGRAVPASARG